MRSLAAVAFVALVALTAGARNGDEPKAAAQKLEGTYEVVSGTVGGKPDNEKDEMRSVVIKGGELTVKFGERAHGAKFALDPSKKPAHIDIMSDKEKEPVLGIYEAKETDNGLELTIAFVKGEKRTRPQDFKGEGDGVVVLKLLRKKAK